jgi:carbamoyl-phosphate synthase large subunit
MGIDVSFGRAFAKAQMSVDGTLPQGGGAILSVRDQDKPAAVRLAQELHGLGFRILATHGTAAAIAQAHIPVSRVNKVQEGRPHIVDVMTNGDVDLVINTLAGKRSQADSYSLRRAALTLNIPYCTTMPGAFAAVQAIRALREGDLEVRPLQDYHRRIGS